MKDCKHGQLHVEMREPRNPWPHRIKVRCIGCGAVVTYSRSVTRPRKRIRYFWLRVIDEVDDLLGHPWPALCRRVAESSWWEDEDDERHP